MAGIRVKMNCTKRLPRHLGICCPVIWMFWFNSAEYMHKKMLNSTSLEQGELTRDCLRHSDLIQPHHPILLRISAAGTSWSPEEGACMTHLFILRWWQLPYYWLGIKLYDLVAGTQCLKGSYVLSKTKALEHFPMLKRDKLVGAIVYYDGRFGSMSVLIWICSHEQDSAKQRVAEGCDGMWLWEGRGMGGYM